MTSQSVPLPSFVRRLAGPVLLFFGVLLAVFGLRSLGVGAFQPGDARNLGALSIGIAAAIVLTRVLDYAIFDVGFRVRRRAAAPALLRQLVSIVVFLAVAAAVIKSILPDVHLGAVFTTSAILTAIVGLALQDTLGNLFAGLALHLERTMRVGDMIRYGETFGTVEQLSWREIRLRTTEGNLLLIPNSLAGRERLEVFARPGPPVARTLRVGLEYDASPEHARETLESALRGMKGIALNPPPRAALRTFDASNIVYELRYWLEDYGDYLDIDARARERVWYALRRAGLALAYNVIRQHVFQAGPLPIAPRGTRIRPAIDGVDLFAALSEEQREKIAAGAAERRYAPDEIIVREGDGTSSMFVVATGRAGVSIHGAGGESRKLAILEPGSAFGEISLLTGERRTATVRALEESVVVEIDKATLEPILRESPDLCHSFERVIGERRKGVADSFEASRGELRAPQRAPLAERISRFFGLS
ncbi:MAG: mechanosensitive ion channel family protein [Acidobacteriota bacterium]|nr:mechanosensitive ion channel family protein [Acidobacteriota bacterium]